MKNKVKISIISALILSTSSLFSYDRVNFSSNGEQHTTEYFYNKNKDEIKDYVKSRVNNTKNMRRVSLMEDTSPQEVTIEDADLELRHIDLNTKEKSNKYQNKLINESLNRRNLGIAETYEKTKLKAVKKHLESLNERKQENKKFVVHNGVNDNISEELDNTNYVSYINRYASRNYVSPLANIYTSIGELDKDLKINLFFNEVNLFKNTGIRYNIIIDPEIGDEFDEITNFKFTGRLDKLLELIAKRYNIWITVDENQRIIKLEKTKNFLIEIPPEFNRKTGEITISNGSIAATETNIIDSFFTDIQKIIEQGNYKEYTANKEMLNINLFEVEPDIFFKLKKYIASMNEQLRKRIFVSMKILSITKSKGESLGFKTTLNRLSGTAIPTQYSNIGEGTDTTVSISPKSDITLSGGSAGITGSLFSLSHQLAADFSLNLLADIARQNDNTMVLEEPSFITLNNQIIKFGSTTKQSKNITIQTAVLDQSGNPVSQTQTQEAETGLDLFIKPTINKNNKINIDLAVSKKKGDISGTGSDTTTLQSTKWFEVKTSMLDNDVLVVGGLKEKETADSKEDTPVLSEIPLLGNLFKAESENVVEREIVILLSVDILNDKDSSIISIKSFMDK